MTGTLPLFEEYGVEEEIDRALARRVPLPSGGSLIIDPTAALVAIDVNTGGRPGGGQEETSLRTDLEAADEIARQLRRLRNLSGQFAVDFVPLKKRENQARVLETLRAAVAGDRCPTHVLGYTKLGLVEMTRQRRSASLGEVLAAGCPACDGTGVLRSPATLAFEALRRALRAGRVTPGAGVEIVAPPAVIEALEAKAAGALTETRERLGGALSPARRPGDGARPHRDRQPDWERKACLRTCPRRRKTRRNPAAPSAASRKSPSTGPSARPAAPISTSGNG